MAAATIKSSNISTSSGSTTSGLSFNALISCLPVTVISTAPPPDVMVVDGNLSGEGSYILYNRLGTTNHISFTVTTTGNEDKFGISLVRGTDSELYYTMEINPEGENNRKVNFLQEGENGKGFIEGIDGYIFARPENNVYNIDIFTDNSVMTLYINDVCAYTNRIYGIQKNCWSINCYTGSISISGVSVKN